MMQCPLELRFSDFTLKLQDRFGLKYVLILFVCMIKTKMK
jgi:hypothetical protein